MLNLLLRYGDSWLVATAVSLLGGALVVALPSSRGNGSMLLAFGGALALAAALGTGLARRREALGRPGVFLRPRSREAMLLAVVLLAAAIPALGVLLRPADEGAGPETTDATSKRAEEQAQSATRREDREALTYVSNTTAEMEKKQRENQEIIRGGGPGAAEARRENQEIEDHLAGVNRWLDASRPARPGETSPAPPDPSKLPPLPRLPKRSGDDPAGSAFATLVGLLAGPLGPIVRELLGLGLGSGYTKRVETVAQTMAGGAAPSVDEIEGVLDAADAGQGRRVREALESLGRRQLAQAELKTFLENLQQATRMSAAEQILAQLEKNPETPTPILLGYLGTSPPNQFASEGQKAEIEKLLVPEFPARWQDIVEAVGKAAPQEARP